MGNTLMRGHKYFTYHEQIMNQYSHDERICRFMDDEHKISYVIHYLFDQ